MLTLLLALASASRSAPADPSATEWLASMRASEKSLRSFQTHVVETIELAAGGRRAATSESDVVFVPPQQLAVRWAPPDGRRLIVTAEDAWLYLPSLAQVLHQRRRAGTPRAADSREAGLSGRRIYDLLAETAHWDPERTRIGPLETLHLAPSEERSCRRLERSLEAAHAPGVVAQTIWLDEALRIPVRSRWGLAGGGSVLVTFSGIRLNQDPPEGAFVFRPPAGVEVLESEFWPDR